MKVARLYELEQQETLQNVNNAKEAWHEIRITGISNIFIPYLDKEGFVNKLFLMPNNNLPLQRTSMFSPPPKPEFNDVLGKVGWSLLLSGIFYAAIFMALFLDKIRFFDTCVNDWGITLPPFFILLGAIAAILGFTLVILHKKRRTHFRTHVIPKWIKAREKWANVYFCEKDWIIFCPGHDHFTMLSDMYNMLYSET